MRATLISVDLVLLERSFTANVRERIAQRLNMPMESIILCATHTHSGPSVGWSPWPGQETYEEELKRKIVEAAQEAQATAAPASVSYAASRREDLSHNRRFVMQDGEVVTHPGPEEGVRHPDGPIDPEIQAMLVTDTQGGPLAVLAGFTCHPTAMGWKEAAISADYPFWIEREVRAAFGEPVETLFFSGALGDVGAGRDWRTRADELGTGLAGRIGREVGREVIRALGTCKETVVPGLIIDDAEVRVPTVDMGPARRRRAEEALQTPEGRPRWEGSSAGGMTPGNGWSAPR